MNTLREHELELAANWAEPENRAELVPGPAPDKIKKFKFYFQKIKSATMPVQHVKGQPAAPTYVREKGCLTFDTNRETPCSNIVLSRGGDGDDDKAKGLARASSDWVCRPWI